MAISLSPQEQKKGGVKITTPIFWNLIGLVGFVLLVYIFLFFYGTVLKAKTEDIKIKIQEIELKRDKETEKEMKDTLSNYRKLKSALSLHARTRNVLEFLEQTNYKGVYFSNFNYNHKENSISLNINSKTATNLSMQLAVFERIKEKRQGIQEIEVGGFSMGEKNISLQIKIIIDPLILKF